MAEEMTKQELVEQAIVVFRRKMSPIFSQLEIATLADKARADVMKAVELYPERDTRETIAKRLSGAMCIADMTNKKTPWELASDSVINVLVGSRKAVLGAAAPAPN